MVCSRHHRLLAVASCMVYGIFNPAYVFFATNYSESFFSACSLMGYAAMSQASKQQNCNSYYFVFYFLVAVTAWMMGSYTRSNGSIHSLWLLQHGLAQLCRHGRWKIIRGVGMALVCVVGAALVVAPVRYHDWQGYQRHCDHGNDNDDDDTYYLLKPSWCDDDSSTTSRSTTFSLYGWTQRQHWNVGFFRYYELKQIPNFLLAAPILGLSIFAVTQWIHGSLLAYGKGKIPTTTTTITTITSYYKALFLLQWPMHALSESVERTMNHQHQHHHHHSQQEPTTTSTSSSSSSLLPSYTLLLHNPLLLGHYAILAILTLVGLILAHVQISTRMIVSSSPAIIWFLTYCLLQEEVPRLRQFVQSYIRLYMLLGILLHVNFLPWT
jgi:phosphatidylinositol glycan class V